MGAFEGGKGAWPRQDGRGPHQNGGEGVEQAVLLDQLDPGSSLQGPEAPRGTRPAQTAAVLQI